MANFMDQYEPVQNRLEKFWADHPKGRVHTEIVLINDNEVVVKASIFTDREDPRPASIDFAQETRNSSQINRTSFLENCSTSAIGRGLASLGYAPKDASKRPSREEMTKTIPAASRDWATEATVLAGTQNIEGLRSLHAQAKRAGVNPELLSVISEMGKALK